MFYALQAGYYPTWWKPPEFFEHQRAAPPSYDQTINEDMVAAAREATENRRGVSGEHDDGGGGGPIIDEVQCVDEDSDVSSSGSEAPPYDEIHQDPIINIQPPLSPSRVVLGGGRGYGGITLPSGAALVLPSPAPPLSQLHHVTTTSRSGRIRHDDRENRDEQTDSDADFRRSRSPVYHHQLVLRNSPLPHSDTNRPVPEDQPNHTTRIVPTSHHPLQCNNNDAMVTSDHHHSSHYIKLHV